MVTMDQSAWVSFDYEEILIGHLMDSYIEREWKCVKRHILIIFLKSVLGRNFNCPPFMQTSLDNSEN